MGDKPAKYKSVKEKVCNVCNILKPILDYHVNNMRSDRHASVCRCCMNKRQRESNKIRRGGTEYVEKERKWSRESSKRQ
jgi:hypothetical protein